MKIRQYFLLLVTFLLLGGTGILRAEIRYLIKFPGINGSSLIHEYQNYTELVSFSFSASRPPVTGAHVSFSGINCIIPHDSAVLPHLFLRTATGANQDEVKIVGLMNIGDGLLLVFELDMRDVIISDFSQSGSDGDNLFTHINLMPKRFGIKTVKINPNGSSGDTVKQGWDFDTNTLWDP